MRYLLLLVLVTAPVLQRGSKAGGQQDSAKPDVRGTALSPLVVKVTPPESTEAERQEAVRDRADHATSERRTANATLALAIFTVFLFLGTAVLAIYTYKLWKTTNKAVTDSESVAKRQAEETQASLAIAKVSSDAAKAAADASVASQRAYMFFDLDATREANAGRPPVTDTDNRRKIVLRNYGKTPAIIEAVYGYFQYWQGGDLDPGDASYIVANWVGAEKMETILLELSASQEEIDRARNGDGALAVIGLIEYRDVFDRRHRTGFCWRYEFQGNVFSLVEDKRVNYHT